jgi:hypothetical protein
MALVTIKFKDKRPDVAHSDAAIDGIAIRGMLMVHPSTSDVAYFYAVDEISVVTVAKEADRVTDSGIVVVKPNIVTLNTTQKGGK